MLSFAVFRAVSDRFLSGANQWVAARRKHSRASEHGHELAPRTSADMDEYVTIASFDKSTDAHIALGRLAAEGVHALLFDDNMVQMD